MPLWVSDASRQRQDGGLPCLACLEPFTSRLVRLSRESRDSRAPSLKSRDEGTHAPRGQRRPCVSDEQGLVCPPAGQRRRPSATGRGTSLVLLLSAVLQAPVRTTRTRQRRCREVPSMVPDPRTSSRSATRGTTSLADFPGCAKSPDLPP